MCSFFRLVCFVYLVHCFEPAMETYWIYTRYITSYVIANLFEHFFYNFVSAHEKDLIIMWMIYCVAGSHFERFSMFTFLDRNFIHENREWSQVFLFKHRLMIIIMRRRNWNWIQPTIQCSVLSRPIVTYD